MPFHSLHMTSSNDINQYEEFPLSNLERFHTKAESYLLTATSQTSDLFGILGRISPKIMLELAIFVHCALVTGIISTKKTKCDLGTITG